MQPTATNRAGSGYTDARNSVPAAAQAAGSLHRNFIGVGA